jgi:hypothetical protein
LGNRFEFEDELDAIRIDLYEQTKGMSIDETVAYFKSLADPVAKEFNIRVIDGLK